MHRRFTAVLALAATAITAAVLVGTASAAGTGVKAGAVTTPVKVNVVMSDFKFRLSTKTVPNNGFVQGRMSWSWSIELPP